MSYKLAVYQKRNDPPAYSAVRLATREECERHGRELFSRWLGPCRFEVHESDDPVNYKADEFGRLTSL